MLPRSANFVTVGNVILDVVLLPLLPAALVAAYLDRRRAQAIHA